jgi:hypothetical protein
VGRVCVVLGVSSKSFGEKLSLLHSCARELQSEGCSKIAAKTGAKLTKTEQIQKTEIIAILPAGKGI